MRACERGVVQQLGEVVEFPACPARLSGGAFSGGDQSLFDAHSLGLCLRPKYSFGFRRQVDRDGHLNPLPTSPTVAQAAAIVRGLGIQLNTA
jgi:hypothetical protein